MLGSLIALGRPRVNRFSPASYEGLQLWVDSSATGDIAYESGTSADLRRIDSITNQGALGGTVAQSTSANKPVNASFPEGKAAFFDGSDDELESSLVASNFAFMHDGTGMTAFVRFRTAALGSDQTLLSTNAVVTTENGVLLNVDSAGNLEFRVMDSNGAGAALAIGTSSACVSANTTHTGCIRFATAQTPDADLRCDGVQVDTGTASGVDVSGPSDTLNIGRRTTAVSPFNGWISEVIIYNRYLTDDEVAQVEAYLANKWTLQITYDELATASVASLYGLDFFGRSTGSVWEDRYGNHSPTEVNSPTHGTSVDFNSKNVITLDGVNQYVTFDSIASQLSGDDTAVTVITAFKFANLTSNKYVFMLGNSGANRQHRYYADTSPSWVLTRYDGTSTASTPGVGTPTTNATISCSAFGSLSGAGQSDLYHNITLIDGSRALDVASVTFDVATMGAFRSSSTSTYAAMDVAAQLVSTRRLNRGDYMAIRYALATEFGL